VLPLLLVVVVVVVLFLLLLLLLLPPPLSLFCRSAQAAAPVGDARAA